MKIKLFLPLALWIVVLISATAIGAPPEAAADPAKQLVKSVLDAYGGKEAVARVKSVVATGTITDFMKKAEGPYARTYARPRKLKIEIMPGPSGELRILNGQQGWRTSRGQLVAVQGPPLEAMIYQYTYLDLPMGFADGTYSIVSQGKTEHKGRVLDLLVVAAEGTPKVRIYLDPATDRIVRAAATFDMGMGSSELATEYEDFRPVGEDKILFPFRLVNYAGDTRLSVITLAEIQLNPKLPENAFAPDPGK